MFKIIFAFVILIFISSCNEDSSKNSESEFCNICLLLEERFELQASRLAAKTKGQQEKLDSLNVESAILFRYSDSLIKIHQPDFKTDLYGTIDSIPKNTKFRLLLKI